jgi:YbbR domain-containing protein
VIRSSRGKHETSWWQALRQVFSSTVGSVTQHWALAGFSLVAAFGIWFVVQDVENPRIQALVPPDPEPPSIPVTVSNNKNDYIIDDISPVQLKVEGRKGELTGLRPEDFQASVDVLELAPGEHQIAVRVTGKPANIRVVDVKPSLVTVNVHLAETKEMQVTVRPSSPLPPGYSASDEPTVDPVTVKIRGIPELVDSVATVDVDANLGAVRGDFSFDGDLVAHTAGGNPVTVAITPSRAHVSYKIQQDFISRTIGLAPNLVGTPAAGYRISNITFDPQTVTVTGPKNVIDGLPSAITLEPISVTGAKTDVVGSHPIDKIPNLIIDRQTVIVRVAIEAIPCSDQVPGPCASAVFTVGPDIKPPAGLRQDLGVYQVLVRVTGPVSQLNTLPLSSIKATVTLTGAVAGTASYPVKVIVPAPFTAEPVDPTISVTLAAGP